MMRYQWMAMVGVAVLVSMLAQPAGAMLNNGFETDYVYVTREAGGGGQLRMYRESDGTQVANLLPDGSNWQTLTFAGTGANDARLFVAKAVGGDVQIDEVDSNGQSVNTAMLSSIVGGAVGAAVEMGNIRYSALHNNLFVAFNPDFNSSTPAMCYEIDLALTTRVHTYQGPNVPDRRVNVDINSRNGTLYMTNRHLGGVTNQGDLIAFSTAGRPVGGTTTTFTTLIDGPSFAAIDGRWNQPSSPIFRKRDGSGEDDTLVILLNPGSSYAPELEFWLDTTAHPSGNPNYLALRGSPISAPRGWNGQQDDVTGHIWFGALRGGFHVLRADDSTASYETGRNWLDADSPYATGIFPPDIAEVTPDPVIIGSGGEYVQQLSLIAGTPPITWSVLTGPSDADVDDDGRVSGWTPDAADVGNTFDFSVQASNAAGSDIETWQVSVIRGNRGFPIDYVYMVRDPGNGGQVRTYNKLDGTRIVDVQPDGTNWETTTFSGRGHDDARLFLARPNPAGTDVEIAELDPTGQILKSANLSAIIGGAVGPAVALGNIRYSILHDTLVVALNPDMNADTTAIAYEIDVDLTTRIHTYLGESLPPSTARVTAAINARDSTLYMAGQHLGDATASGLGDVIGFDTAGRVVGGTTSTFTVLVDGQTYNATNSSYVQPSCPIYRRRPGGDDTLLITTNVSPSPTPVLEFWLDTDAHPVNGDGNLALRGSPISVARGWSGQQDIETGDVWLGSLRSGFHVIRADANDTTESYETTRNWLDAAIPPFEPCNEPFADIDGDGDVDSMDFAVFQRCLTDFGPVAPECACFDRDKDNDLDSFDFAAFEDCGTGPDVPWSQALTPFCSP